EPVGSSRTVHVDVRLIAATHQSLEKLIANGRFREDLYYRLNVVSLELPPLRERREDIFELVWHFLKRACHRTGKRLLHLEPEVVESLENYPWPGNIRELENVIERAVVLSEGDSLTLRELPVEVLTGGRSREERYLATDSPISLSARRTQRLRKSSPAFVRPPEE
ncbi:MAG: sigma 54-interacting transcriptional regulator, partial [Planctomycetaceae bacterium]